MSDFTEKSRKDKSKKSQVLEPTREGASASNAPWNTLHKAVSATGSLSNPHALTPTMLLQAQNIVGNQAVQRLLVQRDFIKDSAGNPVAYEFRVGTELEAPFVTLAQRLTQDGALSDSELRQLRGQALTQRGTVNDHERMFMAGLLDPANVTTFNSARSGANFQFPSSSITRARLDHVNDLDRTLPVSVQNEYDDLREAFARGDAIGVLNELSEIETASMRAILRDSGAFRAQAIALIGFITAHRISAAATLTAMVQAASDNSRGDRILAGIVYAIATHAGHAFAHRLASGDIKVDALVPAALAALPGFSGGEEAAYVTTAQAGGAKGDTMYVKTDLDPDNAYHRSVVIHELQHAEDDAASSATGRPTFPIRNQLEANAYRSQARYIYGQLASQPEPERTTSATEIAGGMNQAVAVALVLEGITDTTRHRPLFDLINQQVSPGQQLPAAQVTRAFSMSAANLETLLLRTINTLYGLTNTDQGVTDGLAGESVMDWINRL